MHRLNFLQVIVILSSSKVSTALYKSFWQLNAMFRFSTHINLQEDGRPINPVNSLIGLTLNVFDYYAGKLNILSMGKSLAKIKE